jgi:hypothetical protein
MKKERIENEKIILLIVFSVVMVILLTTIVSAGILDWIKKTITGYQSYVDLNITVGAPNITHVYNETMTDVSGGPTAAITTNVTINFTAFTEAGASSLADSTAQINFTNEIDGSSNTRSNTTCDVAEESGNYVNYTCNVTMWWWDANGTWNITAYVEDNSGNEARNVTRDFQLGPTTGFVMAPGNLSWGAMAPGDVNQTPTNDPLLMNNTGNQNISSADLQVNATNLTGETTSSDFLFAENFSVSYTTTGTNPECSSTTSTLMSASAFTAITTANMSAGNYTTNDGLTGQEELYVCLRTVGSVSSQKYSTQAEGAWTVKIQ